MDGVENPCCSEQYGVGFPSLGITKRLIPAHLSMLDEKECFSSFLSAKLRVVIDPLLHTSDGTTSIMKILPVPVFMKKEARGSFLNFDL